MPSKPRLAINAGVMSSDLSPVLQAPVNAFVPPNVSERLTPVNHHTTQDSKRELKMARKRKARKTKLNYLEQLRKEELEATARLLAANMDRYR